MFGPNGAIGLYKEGSHEVTDSTKSEDHHPLINEILQHIQSLELPPYIESEGTGIFRAVQITVDPQTLKAQVAFSVAGACDVEITHKHVVSQWINLYPGNTNVIFSGKWKHIAGEHLLPVCICEKQFFFHPGTFIQANIELFETAVEYIKKHIQAGGKLIEYYSGVGVMGMLLAPRYTSVTCVEVNPYAESSFHKSTPPTNASFVTQPAETYIERADVVLLDPPRKGVDDKLLYRVNAPNIVYMSCNKKTFEKDAEVLKQRGYTLTRLATFDFFPGLAHQELLGFFHYLED